MWMQFLFYRNITLSPTYIHIITLIALKQQRYFKGICTKSALFFSATNSHNYHIFKGDIVFLGIKFVPWNFGGEIYLQNLRKLFLTSICISLWVNMSMMVTWPIDGRVLEYSLSSLVIIIYFLINKIDVIKIKHSYKCYNYFHTFYNV